MLDLVNDQSPIRLLIRLTRVARGLRQWDLAEAVNVSRVRISQIEIGMVNAGPEALKRIAKALESPRLLELANKGAHTRDLLQPTNGSGVVGRRRSTENGSGRGAAHRAVR